MRVAAKVRKKPLGLLGIVTLAFTLAWAALGLAFRFSVYASLPIAPDEPYGIADVLELFHAGTLLVLCGFVLVQGAILLVFARFGLRRLALVMVLLACALPVVYGKVHGWVARLAVEQESSATLLD